jgi:hypothetical protein
MLKLWSFGRGRKAVGACRAPAGQALHHRVLAPHEINKSIAIMLGLVDYDDSDDEEVAEEVQTIVSPQKYQQRKTRITTNVQAFRHNMSRRSHEPWTRRTVRAHANELKKAI